MKRFFAVTFALLLVISLCACDTGTGSSAGGGGVEIVMPWEHEVTFHKVAGHADNELNNRCDELARTAIVEMGKIPS